MLVEKWKFCKNLLLFWDRLFIGGISIMVVKSTVLFSFFYNFKILNIFEFFLLFY